MFRPSVGARGGSRLACTGQAARREKRTGGAGEKALRRDRSEPARARAAHGAAPLERRAFGADERPAYEAGPAAPGRRDQSCGRILAITLKRIAPSGRTTAISPSAR